MRQYLKNEVKIRRKNDRSENESGDSNVCVSREGLLRLIHAAWHGACIAAPAAFTGGDRKRKNGGGLHINGREKGYDIRKATLYGHGRMVPATATTRST